MYIISKRNNSDYNKYETDIDSNEVTDPSQNKALESSNLKEKMRLIHLLQA